MYTFEISNGGSYRDAFTGTGLVNRLQTPFALVEELFTNCQMWVQSSELRRKSNDVCNNHFAKTCGSGKEELNYIQVLHSSSTDPRVRTPFIPIIDKYSGQHIEYYVL